MISKSQALRIFCFLLAVAFADQLAGYGMRKLYFTQRTGQNASLNYSLKECKADILIFGNSRAQHNYNTKILSDSLQMSCYNAGMDGGHSILLPYAQIEIILKRYTPKIIIIEFSPHAMAYRAMDYEKLSILLPYYKEETELRPLILLKSHWEKMMLLSNIYPFNSSILGLLRFNTSIDANRKWDINGYIPIKNKQMNLTMSKVAIDYATHSFAAHDKLKALEYIIQQCKNKNVALYFINSPIFHTTQEKPLNLDGSTKQVIEILRKRKTIFIDCSYDHLFIGQMSLFADRMHLNEQGSTMYSKIIGKLLKTRLCYKGKSQLIPSR